MSDFASFSDGCRALRQKSPIIHNITNYVAMSLSANALLAVGASPLMSSEPAEMVEIAAKADALVINLGCLEQGQMEAMDIAARAMMELGKPWVLDPVGAGVTKLRTEKALNLIECFRPDVVRGNASEIMALCGTQARQRGVDAAEDSSVALDAAKKLALKYGTVVSISGPVDYITDGERVMTVENGSPLMTRVTAMGCTASAITAAFLAVEKDALKAAAYAMKLMGTAGERAVAQSEGPGTLAVKFIDILANYEA